MGLLLPVQQSSEALPPPSLVTSACLPQVFLMMFVVYFVVSESLAIKKEGRAYFTLWGNYGQWVFILLTTCTVVVHLSQATLADQQWLKYLNNRKGFTNFYQVAFLNTVFSTLAASLLFLLTVQVWSSTCLLLPCQFVQGQQRVTKQTQMQDTGPAVPGNGAAATSRPCCRAEVGADATCISAVALWVAEASGPSVLLGNSA